MYGWRGEIGQFVLQYILGVLVYCRINGMKSKIGGFWKWQSQRILKMPLISIFGDFRAILECSSL